MSEKSHNVVMRFFILFCMYFAYEKYDSSRLSGGSAI